MKKITVISILFLFVACAGESDSLPNNDNLTIEDSTIVEVDSFALVNNQVAANPNSTTHLFERAKFFIRQGYVNEAQVDLETIFSIDSTNLDVRKKYADILLAKLDLKGGMYHYEYILERDTLNTGAYIGLGKLFALLDNTPKAMINLNAALEINPYLAEPYFMKGMLYRVDYSKSGKQEFWDRALSSFQTAIEQDPNYYSAYVQMGVMYDRIGDDRALEYYNSALDIYPESSEAWYNKGWFYQTRDDVDNALASYRKSNECDSTWAEPYYNQGYIHLMMVNDYDSAIYYFEKATYWDPSYFESYNNIGLAYQKKGDLDNARKFYQKAIEVNPDFKLAKDNLNALM